MKDLLFGSWGPQIAAYWHQHPAHVAIGALSAVSLAITLVFGRPSASGDGGDFSGFGFGDGDGCGD
ncbi:MAG: hypothetical protein QOJ86_3821 [Bradyrhizobium sp.]|nr:hypothetical protein [Bradyrhizobium sp.]